MDALFPANVAIGQGSTKPRMSCIWLAEISLSVTVPPLQAPPAIRILRGVAFPMWKMLNSGFRHACCWVEKRRGLTNLPSGSALLWLACWGWDY